MQLEFFPTPRVAMVRHGKIETDMGGGEKRVITDPVVSAPSPVIDAGGVPTSGSPTSELTPGAA